MPIPFYEEFHALNEEVEKLLDDSVKQCPDLTDRALNVKSVFKRLYMRAVDEFTAIELAKEKIKRMVAMLGTYEAAQERRKGD